MADIVSKAIGETFNNITLGAGQRISIRILNADGSTASTICDDSVPTGMTVEGVIMYGGTMVAAA